jgi:hypothetical protein
VTSLNISRAVTATLDQIATRGGATESIVAGVETPVSGYAVSIPGREVVHHLLIDGDQRREAMAEILYTFAERNKSWLAQPGYYLGAWVDGDRLVLDVTQVTPELGQAVRAGVERDQDAIYNLADGAELWLKRKALPWVTDEQAKVWELLDALDVQALREEKGLTPFEVVGETTVTLKPQPGDLDYVEPWNKLPALSNEIARQAANKLTARERQALHAHWADLS